MVSVHHFPFPPDAYAGGRGWTEHPTPSSKVFAFVCAGTVQAVTYKSVSYKFTISAGINLETIVSEAVDNTRRPVRRRAGAKDEKAKPATKGTIVLKGDGFTMTWKNTRPMPWANFVVFLTDPGKRKRSFHFAWNGERFNTGGGGEDLEIREFRIYEKVREFLEHNITRFCRPMRSRRRQYQEHGYD